MQPVRGAAVLVLLLALAACSSDGDAPASEGSTAAAAPTLVADPKTGTACLSGRNGKPADLRYSVSAATAVASGDLTITGAEALGTGVSLFDSEGVLVIDDEVPMSFGSTDWPIGLGGPATDKAFDVSSRTPLVGMQLKEGQRVQPLLGLDIEDIDDAELTGVRLTWTSGDDPAATSVDLPFSYGFPSGPCSTPSPAG